MTGKPKNIVFLLPSYPSLGGVETVTSLLADYFCRQSFRVYIMAAACDKNARLSQKYPLHPAVTIRYLPESSDLNASANRRYFSQWVFENDIDYIIDQGFSYQFSSLFPLGKRPFYIQVLHATPSWLKIRRRQISLRSQVSSAKTLMAKSKAVFRYVSIKAVPGMSGLLACRDVRQRRLSSEAVVVLAQAYKEVLESEIKKQDHLLDIQVIPNPVWPFSIRSKREKEVLYAGRLSYKDKRLDRLLRIWKQVEKSVPDWRLHLLGDGPDKARLLQQKEALGLQRVCFSPAVWDESLYAEASIACLTSSYEGFVLFLLECQRAGIVPVAFDCSAGIRALIQDQENGLLIPAFDEKAYAESLIRLMKDPSMSDTLSANAMAFSQKYDLERIGCQWLELMEKIERKYHS